MTQWFGGLGVIALFVVVLPQPRHRRPPAVLRGSLDQHVRGHQARRFRGAARKLWVLYIGLTALLRWACSDGWTDFGLYDAVVHALTTMSAGGFSPNPLSMEGV